MKESKVINEENFKIPSDILIDVLALIVREGLKHEFIQVLENRREAIIAVMLDKNLSKHQKIIQNIHEMLEDYNSYRNSENEQVKWREA